jgi:hypothetical protein
VCNLNEVSRATCFFLLGGLGGVEILRECLPMCHGIYIGTLVVMLMPWYLYWCHGIYIVAMVFI